MAYTNSINDYPDYVAEMSTGGLVKEKITNYSRYKTVASALLKYYNRQEIVAGLLASILTESAGDHTVLNKAEYKGSKSTKSWNCGEGLLQWTYWSNKVKWIVDYNKDSRSSQKLPTTWEEYSKGEPIEKNGKLYAVSDGRHISGLTLDNQILFLTKYYAPTIKSLGNTNDVAVICAKIYQMKAGQGHNKDISDPIERAYVTSGVTYGHKNKNRFLLLVKLAQEYLENPCGKNTDVTDDTKVFASPKPDDTGYKKRQNTTGDVKLLSTGGKSNEEKKKESIKKNDPHLNEFKSLQLSLINNTPRMGRDIIATGNLSDVNILKDLQEARKERTNAKNKERV